MTGEKLGSIDTQTRTRSVRYLRIGSKSSDFDSEGVINYQKFEFGGHRGPPVVTSQHSLVIIPREEFHLDGFSSSSSSSSYSYFNIILFSFTPSFNSFVNVDAHLDVCLVKMTSQLFLRGCKIFFPHIWRKKKTVCVRTIVEMDTCQNQRRSRDRKINGPNGIEKMKKREIKKNTRSSSDLGDTGQTKFGMHFHTLTTTQCKRTRCFYLNTSDIRARRKSCVCISTSGIMYVYSVSH